MSTLADRVVVVTGAARGQGRSHALAAARAGARLVLVDRCADSPSVGYPLATELDLTETAEAVTALGGDPIVVTGDVAAPGVMDDVAAQAMERFGRIDALVANAGVHGGGSIQIADRAVWDEVISSNLTGVFASMRAVSPHMIAGGYGRIVATASNQGRLPVPAGSAYVASKWGVIGLVKTAAQDLAQFGITVNAVAPGNTSTPMVHNENLYRAMRPDLEDPHWPDVEPTLLPHHLQPIALLDPAEITHAVMFLLNPGTEHITGAVIDVNAGSSARTSA